eukprot:4406777-Pleurochrysis_carterae.AAC.2
MLLKHSGTFHAAMSDLQKLCRAAAPRSRALARARGLGRACAVAQEGALTNRRQPSRASIQELGERSASAPQVCVRRESKTATVHMSVDLQMSGARDDNL